MMENVVTGRPGVCSRSQIHGLGANSLFPVKGDSSCSRQLQPDKFNRATEFHRP
jgi:hypothetical protein